MRFSASIRISIILIGLYVLVLILHALQDIILPLIFAAFIAIPLSSLVKYFVRHKLSRMLSITLAVLIAFILAIVSGYLLVTQMSRFYSAMPQLVDKFYIYLNQTILWASDNFGISSLETDTWISSTKDTLLQNSSSLLQHAISAMSNVLVVALLIPVYVFMMLLYQPHLLKFIHSLFGSGNDGKVTEILSETKTIIKGYLVGLLLETLIVAVLMSTGLLILGIDYAIILGIIVGLFNIIPMIGGFIGVLLPLMVAIATKASPSYALWVLALFAVVKIVDMNYIVPKLVASKVKINALVTLVIVIAGGALWGIPGMFLAIPLIAIVKLVFDRIENLKPWGFFLGDSN